MTITVNRVLEAVRRLLQDRDPTAPRYSDGDLREAMRLACLDARRVRPDLFVADIWTFPDPVAGDTLPLEPTVEGALGYLTAGHLSAAQQDRDAPGQAGSYMAIGMAQLVSNA